MLKSKPSEEAAHRASVPNGNCFISRTSKEDVGVRQKPNSIHRLCVTTHRVATSETTANHTHLQTNATVSCKHLTNFHVTVKVRFSTRLKIREVKVPPKATEIAHTYIPHV